MSVVFPLTCGSTLKVFLLFFVTVSMSVTRGVPLLLVLDTCADAEPTTARERMIASTRTVPVTDTRFIGVSHNAHTGRLGETLPMIFRVSSTEGRSRSLPALAERMC